MKIAKKLQHELLAENPVFLELMAKGASDNAISQALNVPWERVGQTKEWMASGKSPVWRPAPARTRRRRSTSEPKRLPKYLQHAEEVARLADKEKMPADDIARLLDISKPTVTRAYKHLHRHDVIAAASSGKRFLKPMPTKLTPAQEKRVVTLRAQGERAEDIALMHNISAATVHNIVRRSRRQA